MAKKDKKGDGSVQNREIFQRMNFLYQAAMCMAAIPTPQSAPRPNNNAVQNATNLNTAGKGCDVHIDGTKDSSTGSSTVEIVGDNDIGAGDISGTGLQPTTDIPIGKLSRRKKREMLRQRKNRIAMEQISTNSAHHRLKNPSKNRDLNQLSGAARFYASTLREVGRKNVIRIDPVIKRSICQRCEALLIPSISCEVRVQATPQLHTKVICTACGAFRRFFCMAGRGIEHEHETAKIEASSIEEISNRSET